MDILDKIDGMISEKTSKPDIIKEIMDFFVDNPTPPDSDVHALSDKLGIDTHEFESYIYNILGSFLGYGRAKETGFTINDCDPKELKLGIKVESEHTNNTDVATRIVIDHLAEFDNYYTKLIEMKKTMGGK